GFAIRKLLPRHAMSVASVARYANQRVSNIARMRPVRERLVARFTRLAQVDSPSRREGALARLLAQDLERLGWTVVDDGSGPDCGNVIASLLVTKPSNR